MTKIDIFSGFLGAGKTTLIKKLIAEAYSGEKLVLIENEFGEIGIDGGFLQDAGIAVNELNSGCICCSLVGDFSKALKKVQQEYNPDRILIEPSGVGKLSDVIRAVESAELKNAVINSTACVVDASKCRVYMKNFGEFFNDQVDTAGCIVFSHTDVCPAEKLQTAIGLVRARNAKATVITTPWNCLSGKDMLGAIEKTNTLQNDLKELENEHEHHCCCGGHGHHEHHHDGECGCGHHHDGEHHHEHGEDCCCGGHGHNHGHEHHHDGECGCGHHHDGEHHHEHGEDCCCGGHGHNHEHEHHHDGECGCGHHHDGEHHHEHGEDCCCGGHGHNHGHEHHHDGECGCGHHHDGEHHEHHHEHHHHHADEVFTSWGAETSKKFTQEQIKEALSQLADACRFGTVLRAKGIVAGENEWIHFDYVPGGIDVRSGSPAYTGRLCVIGSKIDEDELKELFGLGE